MTAKILCKKHNSALSPLDTLAGRLMKHVQTAQRDLARFNPNSQTHTFDGHKFERWLLKVALGMWVSGNIGRNGARLSGVPSTQLKLMLLGVEPFPESWGLYVKPPDGQFYLHENEFETQSVSHPETDEIKAMHFKLARVPFTLVVGNPDVPFSWGTYRPSAIIFRKNSAHYVANFTWTNTPTGPPIIYDRLRDV